MGDPGELRWGEESQRGGVRQRRFDLTRDGRSIPGLLWRPESGGGLPEERPLVLVGHGGGGHKGQDYVVGISRRLVRHRGYAVAAIDGPVHGDRRADHGEDGTLVSVQFAQAWSNDDGLTDVMVADWRATLDALIAEPGLAGGPVGYWGLSMGTIFGLPLVAAEPRIQVAVLGLMGMTGPTRERIATDAPRVRCPVLFLTQMQDELFPREKAFELFDALGSTDKRLHAHPGRHAEVPAEEFGASEEFLARHLGG